MITDLVQIRLLGEKKRDENERFRRHMKSRDHSDRILRRIAEGIEEQIDCTQCANCCKVATASVPSATSNGWPAICASSRRVSWPNTRRRARKRAASCAAPRRTGCVFLDGNECTVYDARPETCQRFPHVVRGTGSIASRMWQFVDRACYCPIVYNSLEAFKEELKFKP